MNMCTHTYTRTRTQVKRSTTSALSTTYKIAIAYACIYIYIYMNMYIYTYTRTQVKRSTPSTLSISSRIAIVYAHIWICIHMLTHIHRWRDLLHRHYRLPTRLQLEETFRIFFQTAVVWQGCDLMCEYMYIYILHIYTCVDVCVCVCVYRVCILRQGCDLTWVYIMIDECTPACYLYITHYKYATFCISSQTAVAWQGCNFMCEDTYWCMCVCMCAACV